MKLETREARLKRYLRNRKNKPRHSIFTKKHTVGRLQMARMFGWNGRQGRFDDKGPARMKTYRYR